MVQETAERDAVGWKAIDAALKPIYGEQEPKHWGTALSHRLGGPDPIEGISVFRPLGPPPHWHYVTYGFSELYTTGGEQREWSGFGFELTFRLERADDATEPPAWPLNFLNNLARYVFRSGNAFEAGHHLDLNGKISLADETDIRAIIFVPDPELPMISTPNGRVKFLQVVGITLEELEAVKAWNTAGVAGFLRRNNPLLVTELGRKSILNDSEIASAVRESTTRDGSSTAVLYNDNVKWAGQQDGLLITLGAKSVPSLRAVLPGRIGHGQSLQMIGKEAAVRFEPGDTLGWEVDESGLVLDVPVPVAQKLIDILQPRVGSYLVSVEPKVTLEVVASEIRDTKGHVVERIG